MCFAPLKWANTIKCEVQSSKVVLSDMAVTSHMWSFTFKLTKIKYNEKFSYLVILATFWLLERQLKYKTLPLLQKVLSDSTAPESVGTMGPTGSGPLSHLIQLTRFVIFLFSKDKLHFTHVIVEDETNFRFVEFWVICFKVLRRQKDTEQNRTFLTQK